MKYNPDEQHKRHAFDAYCKRLMKNAAANAYKKRNRRNSREVVFSALPQSTLNQLSCRDDYERASHTFFAWECEIEVDDESLGQALALLSSKRRDIVLLAYFLELSDSEIARHLNIARSTVQYRRTSSLGQLRRLLEVIEHDL